jgi:1-acyl-sn-glycerol-3-phosphate acyltransferase
MPEGGPPGGDGRDPHEPGAPLRVYRGGRTRAPRLPPASPREVARRLSALERRVERALGAAGTRAASGERLRLVADRTLAAFASVRRLTLGDLGEATGGWTMLARTFERDMTAALLEALYRWWWRVEAIGLDHVPSDGRVLLVANRSAAPLPYEAFMIRLALASAVRREAHPLIDDEVAGLPVLGAALGALGAIRGGAALRRRLGNDGAVIVSPESGPPKRFRQRYRLASFGRASFARVAIETGTPIVPVAVIGAEETHPVLARLDLPGRLLGLPTLPITPTFPWLGLAGLVPLPTKWLLLAGEPLDVAARHSRTAAGDAGAVGRLRDQVRERLQALVLEGLRRRRSLFRG